MHVHTPDSSVGASLLVDLCQNRQHLADYLSQHNVAKRMILCPIPVMMPPAQVDDLFPSSLAPIHPDLRLAFSCCLPALIHTLVRHLVPKASWLWTLVNSQRQHSAETP